jgi:hypothetical protein
MGGARYTRSGLIPGGHTVDMIARRDEAVEQIKLLLADQRMSALDVAGSLSVSASTAYGWLVYMKDLGEAHQLDAPGGRKMWALGRDPVTSEVEGVDEHAQRAWIVPARQIGMFRHWMDVALFGPARGAAA